MLRYYFSPMIVYLTVLVSPGFSEETVQRMVPDAEAESWLTIAKLNVAGARWCNAVLISETEALTAAHCLFHNITQHFADPKDLKVVMGQRRGDYAALRGVIDMAVLPDFVPAVGNRAELYQIANDLALIRFDAPVSSQDIRPFEVSDWTNRERVSIVGYGRDRPYLPSIREDCDLTPVSTYVARLSCKIVPGLSGAAVFGAGPGNEQNTLVGIVSANLHDPTGMKMGEAMVVRIGPRLDLLRGLLP